MDLYVVTGHTRVLALEAGEGVQVVSGALFAEPIADLRTLNG